MDSTSIGNPPILIQATLKPAIGWFSANLSCSGCWFMGMKMIMFMINIWDRGLSSCQFIQVRNFHCFLIHSEDAALGRTNLGKKITALKNINRLYKYKNVFTIHYYSLGKYNIILQYTSVSTVHLLVMQLFSGASVTTK